jgi:hypothetical protein
MLPLLRRNREPQRRALLLMSSPRSPACGRCSIISPLSKTHANLGGPYTLCPKFRCWSSVARPPTTIISTAWRDHLAFLRRCLPYHHGVPTRFRKGHGAKNLAIVGHFAINLVRAAKAKHSVKLRRRRHDGKPITSQPSPKQDHINPDSEP